ncbi:hypothetical protein LCGC14_2593180 [marine sediment metagenome]|uniref:Uncharacterized protein n=1 Tax=marine sediment metagenome TaxID=412755 RepID=A0A0F9AZ08_9ZZZZ
MVRTDIYTGDQITITPAKLKKSNIQSKLIRNRFGSAIGIMFYDLDELDNETGGPKTYAPTMFADLIAENRGIKSAGAGPDGEAGEADLMPVGWDKLTQGIKDFVLSVVGLDEPEQAERRTPIKKTKKSKAVNGWLEGS